MKFIVRIDQQEAIRQGVEAPQSTDQVEIPVGDLTGDQRNKLADLTSDGHDLTSIKVVEATLDAVIVEIEKLIAKDRERDRQKAWEAARRELEDAEYEELYERLPARLIGRDEAGYATDREVEDAIRRIILADLDLRVADHPACDDERIASRLTDDQYLALRDLRERLSARADVEAVEFLQHDPCDDECYVCDEDPSMCVDPRVTVQTVMLRVRARRGGFTAETYLPIGKTGSAPSGMQ